MSNPQAAILAAIPHRPPFLLIDQILSRSEDTIVCEKTWRPDEFFYAGHYPDFPITPGVLLCEAAMQAGAVLLSEKVGESEGKVPVATRMNNVKYKQMVRPGDTIEINVTLDEQISEAFYLTAKVTVGGKMAVRFEFACTLVEQTE